MAEGLGVIDSSRMKEEEEGVQTRNDKGLIKRQNLTVDNVKDPFKHLKYGEIAGYE